MSLDGLQDHYDVVVVGSGYGGAVAAARLATAGLRVCVLERGREFQPGQFPATLWDGVRQCQGRTRSRRWGTRTGLFDLRSGPDLDVLVGCGVGGTSLINAGVAVRPARAVFDDDRWPAALRGPGGDALAPYFRRAERMLGVTPYPAGWPGLAKLDALAEVGAALGGDVRRAPLAVSFRTGPNEVGVDQPACRLCGDCVTGCNHGAKNTVAMNYLPLAVRHGAQIFTEAEVRTVGPSPVGGWLVTFTAPVLGPAAPSLFVRAGRVVLAAGALGSTEILFRSRAAGLPVSPRLGHAFSGNGNALAYAYDADGPVRGFGLGRQAPDPGAPIGPSIAGMVHVATDDRCGQLLIEDGAVPGVLRSLLPLALAASAAAGPADGSWHALHRFARRVLAGPAGVFGADARTAQHTLMYLLVSDDPGDGRLIYDGDTVRVSSDWACDHAISGTGAHRLRAATATLGADLVMSLVSRPTNVDAPLTVHPLGGCPMGDDGATGVVDDRGRVYRGSGQEVHDGLLVIDGAIVPRPLGTNPLLTITALAERAVDVLIGERGSAGPARPAPVERPGLSFTERMAGYAGPAAHAGLAEVGAAQGRADGTRIEFTLAVRIDDLPALLDDPERPGTLAGTVVAPVLSPRRLRVVDGVFRLVQRDPAHVGTWHMRYSMGLEADDGRRYRFEGTKILHGAGHAAWSQTTTLRVAITDARTGDLVAAGLMTLSPADLARLVAGMRVTGVPDRRDRAIWLARFHARFLTSLLSVYTEPLGRIGDLPAVREPLPGTGRAPRPLRLPAPEPRWCDGAGRWREGGELGRDAWLRLIRYPGGGRGPVLLAPGFGMSATSYRLDTIETNLTEDLVAHGYDVWLFDYRAGTDLPSARSSFTMDDIALRDWPTAVAEVRRVTGAGTVQALGHCMGSATLMMAIGAGLTGVRSAVCMQSTLHTTTSTLNQAKLALRVDRLLTLMGLRNVAPLRGAARTDTLVDLLLQALPVPGGERCGKAVCRWINAVYGCTHRHAQLDEATHDRIEELFGVGDLTALAHITRMVRHGVAIDADGADLYLAHPERFRLPLLLLQGEHNAIFRPQGSLRTLRWLVAANGPELYRREVLPGYAHLDALIGRDSARDVYPLIIDHLDRFNP